MASESARCGSVKVAYTWPDGSPHDTLTCELNPDHPGKHIMVYGKDKDVSIEWR